MTLAADASNPRGQQRRGGSASATALIAVAVGCALVASSAVAAPRVAASRPLVVLLHDHIARTAPSAHGSRIEAVAARRPLTRARTILPLLGRRSGKAGSWLRVLLPGRPNGHTGWISANRTRLTSTPWQLKIELSSRQLTVYRGGHVRRQFRVVIGKPSTPTPRGAFFIEEALALFPSEPGGPYALATSARSNVFQEFEGGPGQIGIHGTDNLSGAPGSAASHGCVRLRSRAITWLARRIGAGVPLTVTR
jgi:lipoprotein-anchoring transpeptidase ErfK/SrfK